MRKFWSLISAFSSLLFIVGCASQRDNSTVDLIPPDFVVHQIGGTGFAARHVTGPISVNLQIDVINKSSESLKLTQLRMETVGEGAYKVYPTERPFDRTIRPGEVERLEMWVSAQAQDTILGNNGPVTIRGTAYFDSSLGKFQKIFMQQLNDGMKGQREPQ